MGICETIKSFLFETETQRLIKAELDEQRKVNEKLSDKMDNVLKEVNANRSVMVGFGGDFHEILAKIREQLDSQDKVIHEGIGKLLENTEHTQAKLTNYYNEFVSHTNVLYKHDNDVTSKLQIIYDEVMKQFTSIDQRLELMSTKNAENSNNIKTMIQSSHESILEGVSSNSRDVIDKIDESIGTLGNIEEVVTNPKPHADFMELATAIQKGVEHINGFLNDDEYKERWSMKQVTDQLMKVRSLLEAVEALFPAPSGDTQTKILEVFASTDLAYLSPKEIMDKLGMSKKQVYSALTRMHSNGSLVLLGRGQYALPSVGKKLAGDSSEE